MSYYYNSSGAAAATTCQCTHCVIRYYSGRRSPRRVRRCSPRRCLPPPEPCVPIDPCVGTIDFCTAVRACAGNGAQGAQGVQGAQGAQGSGGSGTQGTQGAQGAQGGQGAQGSQGSQGTVGDGTGAILDFGATLVITVLGFIVSALIPWNRLAPATPYPLIAGVLPSVVGIYMPSTRIVRNPIMSLGLTVVAIGATPVVITGTVYVGDEDSEAATAVQASITLPAGLNVGGTFVSTNGTGQRTVLAGERVFVVIESNQPLLSLTGTMTFTVDAD